ncbi:MAG: 1,5-anhydro-D-fructose reductase (1,5-anhydro-D-mannitol-forming) [Halieaceae bacterium]|jgi:1,5-anhydro-D-fructose reductase (1,5-anhydro-D-mannitol-forming)
MKSSVAFIGLGIMGQRMLANMAGHGGFELAAAWDPHPDACRLVATRYPGIALADSAEQLISETKVDAVYIASPPGSHRQYASAAARAGKAVYCEKPLGIDIDESRALVAEVEACGVPSAVNFPFAASLVIRHIENRLATGLLGELTGVEILLRFASWPREWQQSATWLSQRREGGFVREVGSHFIFLAEKLFGPATLKHSSVRYGEDATRCEMEALATLDCNGIPVSFSASAGGAGPDQIEFTIRGSRQSLRLSDWANLHSTVGSQWQDELSESEKLDGVGNQDLLDNFLAMLRGQSHCMASFGAALSVQETVEAILIN